MTALLHAFDDIRRRLATLAVVAVLLRDRAPIPIKECLAQPAA